MELDCHSRERQTPCRGALTQARRYKFAVLCSDFIAAIGGYVVIRCSLASNHFFTLIFPTLDFILFIIFFYTFDNAFAFVSIKNVFIIHKINTISLFNTI